MRGDGDEVPGDLTGLRQDWPGWQFGTVWASAASGPDRRRVFAQCGRVLLTAWTAAELAASLRRETAD